MIYILYYLIKTDKSKFIKFINFVEQKTNFRISVIILDIFKSSLVFNISLLDYFYLKFYEKNKEERLKWAGTGFMYEYQLKMNPRKTRHLLENKIHFLYSFKPLIKRRFADIKTLKLDEVVANDLIANQSGKLVLKGSKGQTGTEVEIILCKDLTSKELIKTMKKGKYDLVEEYVIQHPDLMKLSPSGLNTVRIFTQLNDNGEVDFLGARLRISVNSYVDNMAAGNLAAPINLETGVVEGPGVYSDITKKDEEYHPVTRIKIIGFQVPFWKETMDLAKRAALHLPENRSVGWDIGITKEGPELIEGNHNWCKLLWQLPVKRGLKAELEKYL